MRKTRLKHSKWHCGLNNHRMLKRAIQQGRSERRGEAYCSWYVEPLREARTPLVDFFSILLELSRAPGARALGRASLDVASSMVGLADS